MINPKKLKNIIKYSSFVELALNSNIIFAVENKKTSKGTCTCQKKLIDPEEDKKKEEPVQTITEIPQKVVENNDENKEVEANEIKLEETKM